MSEEHRSPRRSANSGHAKKKSGAKSKSSDSSAVLLWGGIGAGALLIVVLLVVVVLRPWRAVEVAGPVVEQDTTKQDAPPELPKPRAKAFSERAAAEWVVSVGGPRAGVGAGAEQ